MRLLVFGHNDWWTWESQGFCTRAAALVRTLATHDEVERVLVVDSFGPRGASGRPSAERHVPVTEVAAHVAAVRFAAPLRVPLSWHPGRRVNEILAGPGLRRRVKAALSGSGPTVLWVSDPQLVGVALTCDHDLFVFDAIDDWREHWWVDRRAVERGYGLAAERADLVTSVSAELLRRIGAGDRGRLLPNAVAGALWRDPVPDTDALAAFPRPVVGYVGMIQERLDFALLADVARRLPDVSFVLAGPVLLRALPRSLGSDPTLAALWPHVGVDGPAPDNLTRVGRLAYDRLPSWLAACDAVLVPHVHDRMTSSMDPLKIYEGLAAGAPVVSTVVTSSPAVAALVRHAQGADEVAAALRDELAADTPQRRAGRRAALASQTWEARADDVAGMLRELSPGRGTKAAR